MFAQFPPGPRATTGVGPLVFTVLIAMALLAALVAIPPRFASLSAGPAEAGRPVQSAAPTATPAPTLPPASDLHSRWISQTAIPRLTIGTTSRVTLIFRNSGGIAWERGTPAEVRLGVVNDDATFATLGMSEGWILPTRPARQTEAIVKPGETATFTFRVRAVRPGTFELRLRPVVDGVAWLEDQGVFVTVQADALR